MTDTITKAADLLKQVAKVESRAKRTADTENARHLAKVQEIDAKRKAAVGKLYRDAGDDVRAHLELAAKQAAEVVPDLDPVEADAKPATDFINAHKSMARHAAHEAIGRALDPVEAIR